MVRGLTLLWCMGSYGMRSMIVEVRGVERTALMFMLRMLWWFQLQESRDLSVE